MFFLILVVLTPFVMVTKYLQGTIHVLSLFKLPILGIEVPIIMALSALVAIILLIKYIRLLTSKKIVAIIFVIGMISTGHLVQDKLLDRSFFDLQPNWHYLAYGTYIFFFARAFYSPKLNGSRFIILAYLTVLLISTFDETFQYFLSHRVFDISDISKDAWGATAGLIILFFMTEHYGTIDLKNAKWWKAKISDYFKDPATTLLSFFSLTLIFLLISPILSEHNMWFILCSIGFSTFLFLALIFHFMQYRTFRYVALTVFSILFLGLATSYAINRDKNITYCEHGITVYKGIPVVFFDLMIYPNGQMSLLDKKHNYRKQDKRYFLKQEPDILLIASGHQNKGGKGFSISNGTKFIFNTFSMKGTQLIILPTPDAVKKYNELRKAGKKVFLVLHNTC